MAAWSTNIRKAPLPTCPVKRTTCLNSLMSGLFPWKHAPLGQNYTRLLGQNYTSAPTAHAIQRPSNSFFALEALWATNQRKEPDSAGLQPTSRVWPGIWLSKSEKPAICSSHNANQHLSSLCVLFFFVFCVGACETSKAIPIPNTPDKQWP